LATSLDPILQDAVSAYLQAHAQWCEAGERAHGAAAKAYGALETAILYLEQRGRLQVGRGDGRVKHDERKKYAAMLTPEVTRERVDQHWHTRQIDLYYDLKGRRHRQPKRPSEADTEALFDDVHRLLLVIGKRFLGNEEQRILVAQLSTANEHLSPQERLLESIERPIIVGWYDTPASRQLDLLAFEVFEAQIPTRDSSRGLIAMLVAHRAMYQAKYSEGVRFADLALEAYRGTGNSYRICHVYKIKAVCYRELGRPSDARCALDTAFEVAGEDVELINALANERTLQCLAGGETDIAVKGAFQVYGQALEIGERFLIARRKVTALSTLAGTEQAERAEELGDDWELWFSSDNLVARSCYAEVQLRLAVCRGDLDKASQYATLLSSLAGPRKLHYHLKAVRELLPTFTIEPDGEEEA
jgi:tetratricopeptide (TPR) repeat protein